MMVFMKESEKIDIVQTINDIEAEKVKKVFTNLIREYLTPAYGSMSKRDFDILLFMKLQEIGAIGLNPEIYDIVTHLKVSRSKARNLLYEAKMRSATVESLDKELKELLLIATFFKDNDKIAIEIANPFLIDHLRARLKKLGHITDSSFSPELVKLSEEAYIALFVEMMPEEKIGAVKKKMVECGVSQDTSINGIISAVLKTMVSKAAGDVGEKAYSYYLAPIIAGDIDKVPKIFKDFFR